MKDLALQREKIHVNVAPRTRKPKAKHFIQEAIRKPGAFRAQAQRAGESTREFAEQHKHSAGKTGKRARLALTLLGMHK